MPSISYIEMALLNFRRLAYTTMRSSSTVSDVVGRDQVTARVGRGEQVMVCGDAPYLGRGDPERALPLYTTPADYPLWSSKVNVVREW